LYPKCFNYICIIFLQSINKSFINEHLQTFLVLNIIKKNKEVWVLVAPLLKEAKLSKLLNFKQIREFFFYRISKKQRFIARFGWRISDAKSTNKKDLLLRVLLFGLQRFA